MKDTPPEMDARYQDMLMQRSGEERLMMGSGCAMRETARTLIEASIRKQAHRPPLKLYAKASSSASTGTNSMPIAGRRFSLPLSPQVIPSQVAALRTRSSSSIWFIWFLWFALVGLPVGPTRQTI